MTKVKTGWLLLTVLLLALWPGCQIIQEARWEKAIEAEKMEARAQAIRAKHAAQNPKK